MKTKKWAFLTIAGLLLAAGVIALLSSGTLALAAPWSAPETQGLIPGTEMPPLPQAACTVVDTTRTCDLYALPGTLTMPDGAVVPVWGFADNPTGPALVPGPVVRGIVGETLVINLHNETLADAVSLSFPGFDMAPDMDGVVGAGQVKTYTLELVSAGTYFYEAGMTPDGARQVQMGLYGPLIVDDTGTPTWTRELVVVFSGVDPFYNADPLSFPLHTFQVRYWLVNGYAFPNTGWMGVAAGDQVLVRYLNAGVEHMSVALLGLEQQIVAADGNALPFPRGAGAESLAPGQTRDAIIQIPTTAITNTVYPLYQAALSQHNNNQRLPDTRVAFGGMLTFLNVTSGSGGGGLIGPVASSITITPQKTTGADGVTLSGSLADADSNVVQYEYFVDTLGATGTGTIVTIGAPGPTVAVDTFIDAATLSGWTSGDHTLYVRGQDGLGNWGTAGSTVLTLDKAGPAIAGLGLSPAVTNGTKAVTISGTADETATGNSIVTAAEYSFDLGAPQAMTLNPTGATVSGLSAVIPAATIAALPEGTHAVDVRAMDELGNWTVVPAHVELIVDKTGPNATNVALSVTRIDLSKPIPRTVRLTAMIEDPVSGGVRSTLVNAESFIDTQGTPGTGTPLFPSDGLYNSTLERVYYYIPGSHLASLTPGFHTILVSGKDAAGNWGPVGSATIEIVAVPDTTAPVISNYVITPNPTNGATTVTLTALLSDTQSNISGVIWYRGTTPPGRPVVNVFATDGAYDETSETVTATIDITRWRPGTYLISLRGYDAAGNWSVIATITLRITN